MKILDKVTSLVSVFVLLCIIYMSIGIIFDIGSTAGVLISGDAPIFSALLSSVIVAIPPLFVILSLYQGIKKLLVFNKGDSNGN